MKPFREENLWVLQQAILSDQYDDGAQAKAKGELSPDLVAFVKRNILTGNVLECGCGSRCLALYGVGVTHALEPSEHMLERLVRILDKSDIVVEIEQGVVECIPDKWRRSEFSTVIFLNGFFQVRSDYEALIEISATLRIGGRFIFNLYTDDSEDIVCGRVLGLKNYLRILNEFGFAIVEVREPGMICVEKARPFDPNYLRKLQLVEVEDGLYKALNLLPDSRDQGLL